MNRRLWRSKEILLLGAVALLASACASAGIRGTGVVDFRQSRLDKEIRKVGFEPQELVLPFEIDDEMRAWAREVVPRTGGAERQLKSLLFGLVEAKDHKIEYQAGYTPTAKEAFRLGKANCLAFTHLFVGLARDLGLDAYYLDVTNAETFDKSNDLIVLSGHVTAGFGVSSAPLVLKYNVGDDVDYRWVRRVGDLRALAMYYSNRGAETLAAGELQEALTWLRTAVTLDPELAQGWVNYGVALRRMGEEAAAEEAYRQALEVDPRALSAYQNLATLMRLQKRDAEAKELERVAERQGSRNPYNYINLGDLSLRHGEVEEAERFYQKALNLHDDLADPYAALGLLAYQVDEVRDARRWLEKARKRDPENPRVLHLARLLEPGTAPDAGLAVLEPARARRGRALPSPFPTATTRGILPPP
ncbi:MAG: tetratricopeptide repeat protein [Acidobacteria bacterium]|nr:tetratricopeptide repeat protein [Acidobacteriota bacterium]